MNPLTNMKNVLKLSEQELDTSNKTSWHDQYKSSAWIFVGGLPFDLSEGDIICIFSQYGEIVNINLIRSKDTGKSKGFCFLCYEDQRSTVLAVDNFNGIKVMNRTIRVDHVSNYKVPKEHKNTEVETKKLYTEGCAPKVSIERVPSPPTDFRETIADQIEADIKLPTRLPIYPLRDISEKVEVKSEKVEVKKEKEETTKEKKKIEVKKEKEETRKEKKYRKEKREYKSSSEDSFEDTRRKKSRRK